MCFAEIVIGDGKGGGLFSVERPGRVGGNGSWRGEERFKACLALSSDVSVDRLREWFGGQS